MHRFWTSVIEPILTRLGPQVVVEIGSDRAENTRNLVDFCQRHGAVLHAIDPQPGFDVSAYAAQYGGHFVFHRGMSLDVLPQVGTMEAVLIDGDHNWYTVYSELKLIETISAEHRHPFPVVMLHDIDWPYGRRDLYYDPASIPEAFRKSYRRAGVVRNSQNLQIAAGLNSHMNNAACEGDSRNGVLTAIEDFQKGTSQELRFIRVPGFHGLGILFPRVLMANNEALATLVERLAAKSEDAAPIESMEEVRLKLEIAAQALERVKERNGRAANVAPGQVLATLAKWMTRSAERLLDRMIAAKQSLSG